MSKIIDYLKQLELSETEAKCYISLLETGPVTVRELSRSIGVKRTTAYVYIDLLVEKGLVMKMVKGSQNLVGANQPASLKYLVEKKLESAKIVKENFPDILKSINETFPQNKNLEEAEIKYYRGRNGVKKIYEEALKAKELRSYVNIAIVTEALPENRELFTNAWEKNKNIKIFEIIEDSPISREESKHHTEVANYKGYFYKFLPADVTLYAADTLIYDGKVSIVNVGDKITGVVLHNLDYYYNSKELFDFIWRILPEVKH